MTRPEPLHPLDVTFLLHAVELLDGDPQVDDLGPLYAAVARVNARAMEHDIYGSLYLKAGALLQTLAKNAVLGAFQRALRLARDRGLSDPQRAHSTTLPRRPSRSCGTLPPGNSASPGSPPAARLDRRLIQLAGLHQGKAQLLRPGWALTYG